jgi:hypothetical protein
VFTGTRETRNLIIVALAHAVALIATTFVLLLGDTLFASYATLAHTVAFSNDAIEFSWLQRMTSDVHGAVIWVVGLSALLQMVRCVFRTSVGGRVGAPSDGLQAWVQDGIVILAGALRAVGVGLAAAGCVSMLSSAVRQSADARAYAVVAAAVAGVCIAQWFTGRSPATLTLSGQDRGVATGSGEDHHEPQVEQPRGAQAKE